MSGSGGGASPDDSDPLRAYPYLLRGAATGAATATTATATTTTAAVTAAVPSATGTATATSAAAATVTAGAEAGSAASAVADAPFDYAAPVAENASAPEPPRPRGHGRAQGCADRRAEHGAGAGPYDYAAAEAGPGGAHTGAHAVPMTWTQARALAARAAGGPRPPVRLPFPDALGGTLAAPLEALTDLPAFDTSAMDGWAVSGPGPWRLVGSPSAEGILAGRDTAGPLADGAAVRIATGAQLPPGATAVLRSEDGRVRRGNNGVELLHDHGATPLEQGRDIRPRGQECRTGELLLPPGTAVTPAVLGLAAAAGCDLLSVHRRPTVELLVLGDELLDSGVSGGGRIRDALGPLLPSWLRAYGARVGPVRRIGDDLDLLTEALLGSTADVVVTTGGTAAGPVDFLHRALAGIGARLLVDGVRVRPGHPMLLAALPSLPADDPAAGADHLAAGSSDTTSGSGTGRRVRHVVGLPGNPLAAVAGAVTLAEPLLRALGGSPAAPPYLVEAAVALPGHPEDTRLVPAVLPPRGVLPLAFDGPAMLRGLALAEGLAVVPPGGLPAGARVEILEVPAG